MVAARALYAFDKLRRRHASLADVAERDVIAPACERWAQPAIHLEGQLDRVMALQSETTEGKEARRLRGGLRRHDATAHLLVRDAVLVRGDLYAGGVRLPLRGDTSKVTLLAPAFDEIDEAALAQTWNGWRYFGHWLLDDRPLQWLASTYAEPVCTAGVQTPQQHEYLALLGQRHPRVLTATRVRRLHVFEDIGQNDHRRQRLEEARACFQARGGDGAEVVLVCRGTSGARRVLWNEPTLAQALEKRGVTVVADAEHTPLEQLCRTLSRARLVVGLDSSALTHGILGLRGGGGLLDIMPADRFTNVLKDWCDAIDLRYGLVMASPRAGGYFVDEDEVMRTIDLMLRATS